jgi:hypothetical protein
MVRLFCMHGLVVPDAGEILLGELVDVTLANNVSMGVAAPSTLRLTGQRF